jgi:rSAM/selenodomain-associated transferase 2
MQTRPELAFSLSVIIPTLNEGQVIRRSLANIRALGDALPDLSVEVILVDGGSADQTIALAREGADQIVETSAGRARQMNAGAAKARHAVLLFLHGDTLLPHDCLSILQQAFDRGAYWGRFDVQFDSPAWRFRGLAWMMNWRSRITGICTGDQAIFVRRDMFEQLGGFASIDLMEDIELSRRLRRLQPPFCIHSPVVTACRRWQRGGFWATVWLMWSLRWRYFWGASPATLVNTYYPSRHVIKDTFEVNDD